MVLNSARNTDRAVTPNDWDTLYLIVCQISLCLQDGLWLHVAFSRNSESAQPPTRDFSGLTPDVASDGFNLHLREMIHV